MKKNSSAHYVALSLLLFLDLGCGKDGASFHSGGIQRRTQKASGTNEHASASTAQPSSIPASEDPMQGFPDPASVLPDMGPALAFSAKFSPASKKTHLLDWTVNSQVQSDNMITLKTGYSDGANRVMISEVNSIGGYTGFYNLQGYKFTRKFVAADLSKLDILVVVDNSASIDLEQKKLAAGYEALTSGLNGVDWRIVVTTVGFNSDCATKIISKGDTDAATKFRAAVMLGSGGSNMETPYHQIMRHIGATGIETVGPSTKCNSLRPGVGLAVVVMTNEDECSNGVACPYGTSAGIFGPSGKRIGFYSSSYSSAYRVGAIYWAPSLSAAQCPLALNSAKVMSSLFLSSMLSFTSSISEYSVCAPDYIGHLTDLNSKMMGMKNEYHLRDNVPYPLNPVLNSSTIVLRQMGNVVPASKYHYDANLDSLVIDDRTLAGDFSVEYEFNGTASSNDLVINTPDPSKTTIDHVTRYLSDFSMSELVYGTDYTLEPRSTSIVVQLKVAPKLGESYSVHAVLPLAAPKLNMIVGSRFVGPAYVADTFTAKRNGQPYTLKKPTYDAASGNVLFGEDLPAGTFDFSWRTKNDAILNYALASQPGATIIRVEDYDTGTEIPLVSGSTAKSLTFRLVDIIDGRKVRVKTKYPAPSQYEAPAVGRVIPDSLKVKSMTGSGQKYCSDMGAKAFELKDGKIALVCDQRDGVDTVGLEYGTVEQPEFIDFPVGLDALPNFSVELWLNGKKLDPEEKGLRIEGSRLVLGRPLELNDEIEVRVYAPSLGT